MTPTDKSAGTQPQSLSFEFDLNHPPEKVWRALTDPTLLAEWLLPVVNLKLEPGAAFTFKTQPYPGWDGTVNCRMLEIEPHRKLSYSWVVGDMEIDTVVTFMLAPTASGTRLSLVQSGFKPTQKQMLPHGNRQRMFRQETAVWQVKLAVFEGLKPVRNRFILNTGQRHIKTEEIALHQQMELLTTNHCISSPILIRHSRPGQMRKGAQLKTSRTSQKSDQLGAT